MMQILKKVFPVLYKELGIQFDILRKCFICTSLSLLILILEIFLVSVVFFEEKNAEAVKSLLGFELFSKSYFYILGILFLVGILAIFISVVITGIPAGREMKNKLNQIRDANEKLSRGKLETRLDLRTPIEFQEISSQFNSLAQQMHTQVESLQRLIQENKQLATGADETASIEERRKIARELHDSISQQLFAISTLTAAIRKQFDEKPEEARHYLTMVEKTT
jgi:two-component system, NarL family, sensor histidine kinase LiaS